MLFSIFASAFAFDCVRVPEVHMRTGAIYPMGAGNHVRGVGVRFERHRWGQAHRCPTFRSDGVLPELSAGGLPVTDDFHRYGLRGFEDVFQMMPGAVEHHGSFSLAGSPTSEAIAYVDGVRFR